MPTQAELLDKLSLLRGQNLTSAAGQDSYNALQQAISIMPNLEQDPRAAATIMATLMIDNQRLIDKSQYLTAFGERSTSKIVGPGLADFRGKTDTVYNREIQALTALFSNPAAQPYIQKAMTDGNPARVQEILRRALGNSVDEVPPKLYRYFVSGGNA
jgi:hypothetical protein